MGSSRTFEIDIRRVLSEFICYQEVSGEGQPQGHVERQPTILYQEYGARIITGKWWDMVMTRRSYFGVSNFCPSILDMFAVVMRWGTTVRSKIGWEQCFVYKKEMAYVYHLRYNIHTCVASDRNLRRVTIYTLDIILTGRLNSSYVSLLQNTVRGHPIKIECENLLRVNAKPIWFSNTKSHTTSVPKRSSGWISLRSR